MLGLVHHLVYLESFELNRNKVNLIFIYLFTSTSRIVAQYSQRSALFLYLSSFSHNTCSHKAQRYGVVCSQSQNSMSILFPRLSKKILFIYLILVSNFESNESAHYMSINLLK